MSYNYIKPLDLFESEKLVKICAPMVRYSKLPFRCLVRKYDCDLAFTPMIISSSFVQSEKARQNEFSTNLGDRPLIAQFAANNGEDLARAAEIIYPFCDGVDLNCGCPQKWAMAEGYGSCLIKTPEHLRDIVLQTRNRISDNDFTISIKIRLHNDIKKTVEMCRIVEKAGISWITVHGRTPDQRREPVNNEAIKDIVDSVHLPVIANGDIFSLEDGKKVHKATGVKGVMAARGILENPAMYSGHEITPYSCVQEWLEISSSLGIQFQCFHHHLIYMLQNVLTKSERRVFNSLSSAAAVIDYLDNYYLISE